MSETSSVHSLPMRYADFPTLVDALDYAALGNTGMNFYDRRNQLVTVLDYRTLQQKAISGARRLLSLKLKKGDRVALIAETSAGFVEAFSLANMPAWWRCRWRSRWAWASATPTPPN